MAVASEIHVPPWAVVPFAGLLLGIAVLPIVAHHWWEKNRNRAIVSALFALPITVWLLLQGSPGLSELVHKLEEYASFILLLGSLFVISGGIHIRGSFAGTPLVNTAILGIGAAIASLIGTTGASVLLVRPLLRANQARVRRVHIVVFFIFTVSNCGGLLTPLGDPPLFLGFLKGVPFDWTLKLWREWLLVNGAILVIFHVWDQIVLGKEEKERPGSQLEEVMKHAPFGIDGARNFLLLLGIVLVILGSGQGWFNDGQPWPFGVQESLMGLLALAGYFTTPRALFESNRFSFGPIIEVAVLFAGIFVTMAPALLLLNANAKSFGLSEPWQFFWATGILSSFLDNAPTYLTFAATACGLEGIPVQGRYLAEFLAHSTADEAILAAISCGAVFMGANTYIGNGPNFMVKAIAEENGVKMPGFFAYMAYSFGILGPILVGVTFLFFA